MSTTTKAERALARVRQTTNRAAFVTLVMDGEYTESVEGIGTIGEVAGSGWSAIRGHCPHTYRTYEPMLSGQGLCLDCHTLALVMIHFYLKLDILDYSFGPGRMGRQLVNRFGIRRAA